MANNKRTAREQARAKQFPEHQYRVVRLRTPRKDICGKAPSINAATMIFASLIMRDHLATLLEDFRRYDREIAVVRYQGNRRRVTTYGELARLAGRFASLLEQRGIGPGDRVVIWGENSAEWIAAFYGCMVRGVLAVPLDAYGTPDFANRVTADVEPKLAVGDALLLRQLSPRSQTRDLGHPAPATPELPLLAFEGWKCALPATEALPVAGLSSATPLEILFTSGTTGDPKGIVITHGNVLSSVGPVEDGAQPYMRYEKLVHPLRILHTLPLSHVYGQTMGLWVPPILKAELHFESRLAAPRLIEMIRKERISVLAAVPRVLALLKTHLETTHERLAERVAGAQGKLGAPRRWMRFLGVHREFGLKFWAIVSGGGALPGPLEQFWNALGFVLIQGYGMTETTAIITLNHPFHVASGTIGKPLPGREVKLGPDGEVLVRGAMIAGATWSGGKLRPRQEEWLATGDIAAKNESGDLKFLGRKSEVIVTAAGLNLHPEDIEAVVEEQPGVAACAVVPTETATGTEACAVIACRGSGDAALIAVENANLRLAEFQRILRWVLWPEPDLPRTSTGKVKRKEVAAWLARLQRVGSLHNGSAELHGARVDAFGLSSDWLLALISQVSGEEPPGVGDELRLTEDLHLDSLGRVQLAAAIEEKLGIVSGSGLLEEVHTLGELRRLVAGESDDGVTPKLSAEWPERSASGVTTATVGDEVAERRSSDKEFALGSAQPRTKFIYPTWPWWRPVQWLRVAFLEAVVRPLVWLLAAPRVADPARPLPEGPMLIVANHASAFDGPILEYSLEGRVRRHIATAMLGEMLQEYRRFRNPEPAHPSGKFFLPGPLYYFLVTALFNVFPLPRQRDFQSSFAHAGRALDRGYNVLVFPEGARSADGKLARFRHGIGLLARQSNVPVLPIAIRGLGELKAEGNWFRSGKIEVVIGEPIEFGPDASEAEITERLHHAVKTMLEINS